MRAALSLTKGNIELLEEVASGCDLLLPHVPAKFMNFDIYFSDNSDECGFFKFVKGHC